MSKPSLNVQCFVEKEVKTIFRDSGENHPKLLYVSEIRPDASTHPRVMHAHEDFVELILICSGSSEYLIHDKKVVIQAGDRWCTMQAWCMMRSPGRIWRSAATAWQWADCICPVCGKTR